MTAKDKIKRVCEEYLLDYYQDNEGILITHNDVIEEAITEVFQHHHPKNYTKDDYKSLIETTLDDMLISKVIYGWEDNL